MGQADIPKCLQNVCKTLIAKSIDANKCKGNKTTNAKIQSQLFHKNIIKRKTLFVKSKKKLVHQSIYTKK